jgi:broad specificity phosphatase PhoE
MSTNKFGRVDAENNVFVIDGSERKVGQYPGVTPDEALAYFVRKFEDIAAQVRILEQRVANKVDSHGMKKMAAKLAEELKEPAVVGDIADLRRRVGNLDVKISALVSEKQEASKEATAEALASRLKIAVRAEEIANQDAAKTQWKTSGAEMTKLFEQWQELQKSGPKVAKSEADSIWKRFSSARTRFETAKRGYFAGLDATNKQTKAKKTAVVEQAEALAAKGSDDIAAYRKLLDEWKNSGRTPGKSDDALWARFKAAGDAIFAKKSETAVVENAEQEKNLAAKLEILKDAASIDPEKDLAGAKKTLQSIQQRWEKAGRVPKDKLRETEDKLRAIEAKVRKVEEDEWRKTDPAAIERSNSVTAQLEDSIKKLEAALEKATASKDAKKIKDATEALEARKAWLEVVKATMA